MIIHSVLNTIPNTHIFIRRLNIIRARKKFISFNLRNWENSARLERIAVKIPATWRFVDFNFRAIENIFIYTCIWQISTGKFCDILHDRNAFVLSIFVSVSRRLQMADWNASTRSLLLRPLKRYQSCKKSGRNCSMQPRLSRKGEKLRSGYRAQTYLDARYCALRSSTSAQHYVLTTRVIKGRHFRNFSKVNARVTPFSAARSEWA